MNIIETKCLCKAYSDESGKVGAVKNIDISIEKGSFVSITGRSGSGKSTLLKMLGGLLMPTEGTVYIGGRNLYEMSEKELAAYRCNEIGFVFQDYILEETYTVSQNIEIALMIAGIPPKGRMKIIDSVLDEVGMIHKKNSRVKCLSGGEKQRVCIATAIANNPQIILADEPCGSLDYKNGRVIMELFRKLRDAGKTVILVTHILEDANMTDRIITLKDGCIIKNEDIRYSQTGI